MSVKSQVCVRRYGSINMPIINRKQSNFGPSIWVLTGNTWSNVNMLHIILKLVFWAFWIWTNLKTQFCNLTLISWWQVSNSWWRWSYICLLTYLCRALSSNCDGSPHSSVQHCSFEVCFLKACVLPQEVDIGEVWSPGFSFAMLGIPEEYPWYGFSVSKTLKNKFVPLSVSLHSVQM